MAARGGTGALTTLSPVLPERMRALKNRLRVVRFTPGLGRPLLQLGFIHYARWIVMGWVPSPDGGGGRLGLRWTYLLFESNFDATETEYLRTFADIVPARIASIWSTCFGFDDNAERGAGAAHQLLAPAGFRSFVKTNTLDVLTRYVRFPDATAIDIAQAIAINDLLSNDPSDPNSHDTLLNAVEEAAPLALGPQPPPLSLRQRARNLVVPWKRAVVERYSVNPLTIIAALTDDGKAALETSALRAIARWQRSRHRDALRAPRHHPTVLTDLGSRSRPREKLLSPVHVR